MSEPATPQADLYKGWKEWTPTPNQLEIFYQTGETPFPMKENEFIIIRDSSGAVIDKRCFQKDTYRPIKYVTYDNIFTGKIKARNDYQSLAMDMLADKNPKIKVIRGVYGSGKDLLMLSQALTNLKNGKFAKIVYVRPNVTVKDVPDIGALPGTAEEKLFWTLGPIFDKVGGDTGLSALSRNGQFEIVPLVYIRGRSFENSIIYVSEGQNMTTEIAKLVIGRVGEGSELWINGDTHQSDKKVFDRDNGISKMVERLSGNKLFSYVYLPITERSDVANLANLLDD